MKMLLKILPILLVLPNYLVAQDTFYDKQQLYVWAKDGIILRDAPFKKSLKIKNLSYGTKVVVVEKDSAPTNDSVLVIPAAAEQGGRKTLPFFLPGYWVYVITGRDSGYVFSGYLSKMEPFTPVPVKDTNKRDLDSSIGGWLTQKSGVLDNRIIDVSDGDYTRVYKNHVVEYYHTSEGGGSVRYTFQYGMSFQDGFLLLNYFENLHFTKAEIKACETFELTSRVEYLFNYSIGLRGGIANMFRLSFKDGILIIEIGGGC